MQRSSRPRRAARVSYLESDSEFDLEESSTTQNSRPTRAARAITTYRESSDASSSTDDDSGSSIVGESSSRSSEVDTIRLLPRTQRDVKLPQRKRKIELSRGNPPFSTYKRRKPIPKHRSAKPSKPAYLATATHTNEKAPPWQQLPYHILLDIVQRAAYPLYERASRSTSSIGWLFGVSTLCRSFHEACISTLLYSPPVYPAYRAHGLIALLKSPQEKLTTDYRTKIKCLELEVKALLIRKSGIDLEEILKYTPLLERLRLYHNHDDYGPVIWAQPSASKDRWAYPGGLFEKIREENITLKSFEWNGRFPNTNDVLDVVSQIHGRTSFAQLKELTLVNMILPERSSDVQVETWSNILVVSLQKLERLQSLILRNCNIATELVVPFLPKDLHHVEFSNCQNLTSSSLERYLNAGGSRVKNLLLAGNQSMSLGFFANLKALCPMLEHLQVDLTYTDPTSYRDRDPLYEDLLPDGPPTWPESLISISIENLRQVSAEEAEAFFTSLVDAACNLPYLKTLIIKAILNGASWRDRAEMRKKWMPILENVFLSESPSTKASKKLQPHLPSNASSRQSTRIARSDFKNSNHDSHVFADDQSATSMVSSSKMTRQGRCDVVQLLISDQRPAQDQYHENDFLDDEPSGDDEWRE